MGDREKIEISRPTFLPLKNFFWGVGGSGSKEKLAKRNKVKFRSYSRLWGEKKFFLKKH